MSYLYFLLFCFYLSGLITSVGEERAVDFFSHLLVIILFPFEGVPICALDRLRYLYTTQNLISIQILFLLPGYPSDGIPQILLQECSTTIAL